MAEKDIIMKYLSHISPDQITDFLGIQANGVHQCLSEELKDIRMTDLHADFVLETDASEIIHVEFQQSMTRDTLNRFFVYNALLTRQFDKDVITYIIYLGKTKISRQVIKNRSVSFTPEIVKVYELDAKSVLERVKNGEANYIEMALMPLMKNSTKEEIVELVDEEAKMKITRELKDDIITATLVMAGTAYDETLVETLKRRVREMFNVDIFEKERKEAIEQGLQQGLKQGLRKGKLEGELEKLREVVSRQLLSKFKEKYTKELREKVRNGDMETLEYIADHIFDITLDEVKKLLSNS
ncbi:hypothetical protein [Mesoaciditoga lauensis]|uniref:hypothetical protein n=1 Tax=Mesoaciditoga lauensis TaxID=1495039 RepID=UPI00055CC558|nr:hypothetical protein [Mesoaciditoga lauensis]